MYDLDASMSLKIQKEFKVREDLKTIIMEIIIKVTSGLNDRF